MSLRDLRNALGGLPDPKEPVGVERKDGWTIYHDDDNWGQRGYPPRASGFRRFEGFPYGPPALDFLVKRGKLPVAREGEGEYGLLDEPFGVFDTMSFCVQLASKKDDYAAYSFALTRVVTKEAAVEEAERTGQTHLFYRDEYGGNEKISLADAKKLIRLARTSPQDNYQEEIRYWNLWIPTGPKGIRALGQRMYFY